MRGIRRRDTWSHSRQANSCIPALKAAPNHVSWIPSHKRTRSAFWKPLPPAWGHNDIYQRLQQGDGRESLRTKPIIFQVSSTDYSVVLRLVDLAGLAVFAQALPTVLIPRSSCSFCASDYSPGSHSRLTLSWLQIACLCS